MIQRCVLRRKGEQKNGDWPLLGCSDLDISPPKLVCKGFIKKVFPGKTKKEEKQDREETEADQV